MENVVQVCVHVRVHVCLCWTVCLPAGWAADGLLGNQRGGGASSCPGAAEERLQVCHHHSGTPRLRGAQGTRFGLETRPDRSRHGSGHDGKRSRVCKRAPSRQLRVFPSFGSGISRMRTREEKSSQRWFCVPQTSQGSDLFHWRSRLGNYSISEAWSRKRFAHLDKLRQLTVPSAAYWVSPSLSSLWLLGWMFNYVPNLCFPVEADCFVFFLFFLNVFGKLNSFAGLQWLFTQSYSLYLISFSSQNWKKYIFLYF